MQPIVVQASYFDGLTAKRHAVEVIVEAGTGVLTIRSGAEDLVHWPLEEVRRLRDVAHNEMTFWRKGDEAAARLLVHPGDASKLVVVLPNLDSRDMTRAKWGKIVGWTTGALAAIYAMVFWIVPALAVQMAGFIKPETEASIGRAALHQIEGMMTSDSDGGWFCDNPEGVQALNRMVGRVLGDQDIGYDLQVRAVDHPMLNAFALPGGQVILMRGLIEQANTADQVAGVLAHEIAHVAHRHPIEGALRTAGSAGIISLLLGDASGGTLIAFVSESLVNASYTRSAEEEADTSALKYLQDAGVSSQGFANFFDKLVEEYGEGMLPAWASTHPPSAARADQARAQKTAGTTPVINDADWQALKKICD